MNTESGHVLDRKSSPLWIVLFLLLAPLGAVAGCSKISASQAKPKPLPPVVVATPVILPIVEWDEFVGRLAPIESVQVRARVSGYLATTSFEEGQIVRAGDLLAVVDQRPFQAEVNRNEANVAASQAKLIQTQSAMSQSEAETQRAEIHRDLTQKTLNRTRDLVKVNATAIQDLEVNEAEYEQAKADVVVAKSQVESAQSAVVAAQADVRVAEANLELAKLNLQYAEVRAPITGRISSRYVTEGNLVSGGTSDSTLLTTIVSLDPIHCYFDADESTFLKYTRLAREGKRRSSRDVRNPVYLALANERGTYPHHGHMDFVENRLDEETGTIRGRAILPNKDLDLAPGLFARVRLPGSQRYDAILIPDQAIGTDQVEKFVLILGDNSKVDRRLVVLGPISHGLRVIREGLTGSERVIISGQQRARPGMEVAATTETVTPGKEVLPDEYEPFPAEQWLTPKRTTAGNVVTPANDASSPKDATPDSKESLPTTDVSPNPLGGDRP